MTPYLTQATIPYEIAAKWARGHGFTDAYAWHQRVWEAFPGSPEKSRDFLSRVDPVNDGFRLLLLSSDIPSRPDWCPASNWKSKAIPAEFLTHTRYRFSLLANPTRKVRSEIDGQRTKNGRREPITHRDDREQNGQSQSGLLTWLTRKGAQHGFRFDPATLKTIALPRQSFTKGNRAGTHAATDFQGILEVTDPTLFGEAFRHGVGSAKAFGFGMLCLAPLSSTQTTHTSHNP